MGTRSVIAVPLDGGFQGRYCHWDGYPTGVGKDLQALVNRDGLDTVIRVLTQDNYGWSGLMLDMGAEFDTDFGYDADGIAARNAFIAEHGRYPQTDPGRGDGRFRAVEGYGTAYTTVAGQSSPDEWIRHTDTDTWCEWGYILNPDHITVLRPTDTGWNPVGSVRYDEDPEKFAYIEQGAYASSE